MAYEIDHFNDYGKSFANLLKSLDYFSRKVKQPPEKKITHPDPGIPPFRAPLTPSKPPSRLPSTAPILPRQDTLTDSQGQG